MAIKKPMRKGFIQGSATPTAPERMRLEGLMKGSILRVKERRNTPKYPKLSRSLGDIYTEQKYVIRGSNNDLQFFSL